MRKGIDSNILVAVHMPAHQAHEIVRAFLHRETGSTDCVLVVTPLILHEFVHVVTDARRFDPPVAMAEALAVARLYLGRSNVECLPITEEAVTRAFDLMERYGLGRKRIADTLLAAALLTGDVHQIVTLDAKGFEVFEGLEVVDPSRNHPF